MLSKKEIKDIQSLDLKKFREEQRLFIAEGAKIVSELIDIIPQQIVKVYALAAWANENVRKNIPVEIISDIELEKISQLQTSNVCLAVIRQFEVQEPHIENEFCLYLDKIQDPGNLGTIIRIADWFGIKNVICSAGCVDVYNSKVVQSSMASIGRVAVYYDKQNDWLQKQNVPVFAATLQGKPPQTFSKPHAGILIIGNESKGISTEILEKATHQVTIPRKGAAESLNAAVATGIILSHLLN